MNRIKSLNGYTIFQAGPRDVKKHGFTEGGFYVYFTSDVRDFGIANSSPEFEDCGSIEEAAANCEGNFAIAKEIVESRTTAASMTEILEVEKRLDDGADPDALYEEGLEVVDDDTIQQAREAAAAAGLPFSDRPADSTTEPDPYVYDGSMTVTDFRLMQKEHASREELAAVVTAHSPLISPVLLDQLVNAAAGLRIETETMQRILDSFSDLAAAVKKVGAALVEMAKSLAGWAAEISRKLWEAIARSCVPPKWWHLYKHAKKARVRKKYHNRIQRAIFCTLAAEGGGSS